MIALRTATGEQKVIQQQLWIAVYAAAAQGVSSRTAVDAADVNKFASTVADQAVKEFENRLNPNVDQRK